VTCIGRGAQARDPRAQPRNDWSPRVSESLAFLPGYGIKAYLIAQDINQLYAHYGRDEASPRLATCQCAFAPNRIETAEHLSKLTGQTTVVKEQVTTSGRGWSTNVSRSTHEVSRPLLTPDEAMRMKGARKNAQGMITEPGNMVIYVAGYPAIMGLQPLFPRFRARPPRPDTGRVGENEKARGHAGERQRIKNAWKRKAGVRRTFAASRRSYGCSPDLGWNIECMGSDATPTWGISIAGQDQQSGRFKRHKRFGTGRCSGPFPCRMRGLRLAHYPRSILDKKQGTTCRRRLSQTARKPSWKSAARSQKLALCQRSPRFQPRCKRSY
jgi:Type IV secretory system Conjugative DNA transfer